MDYQIGTIIDGTVTGIQPYGAFVSLDKETQGLIHVSEIQSGYTKNIHDVLQVARRCAYRLSISMNIAKKSVCPAEH